MPSFPRAVSVAGPGPGQVHSSSRPRETPPQALSRNKHNVGGKMAPASTDVFSKELLARAFDQPDQKLELPSFPPPKLSKDPQALSWQDVARNLDLNPITDPESSHPIIRPFDRSLLSSVDTLGTQYECRLCPFCKRPCIDKVLALHIDECVQNPNSPAGKAKKAALEDRSGSDVPPTPASESDLVAVKDESAEAESDGDNAPEKPEKLVIPLRKRKAEQEDGPNAKKIRKAQRQAKQRQPFNPDKQCGVPLQSGQPCARSLTCKVHSMGAKRAVPGRSAPYDVLLANYQRQNMVKQAALSTERELASEGLAEDQNMNPEKEIQQVMEGVRRAQSFPLDRRVIMPTRMRTQNFRLREMLALALLPKGFYGGGDAIYGRALSFSPETPNQFQYVRAPAVQRYLMAYQRQQQQRRQQQMQQQQQPQQQSAQAQAQAQAQQRQSPQMRGATPNGSRKS